MEANICGTLLRCVKAERKHFAQRGQVMENNIDENVQHNPDIDEVLSHGS